VSAVVEVGPATVRGAARADCEVVSTAIEYIDDALGLLDERAVSVTALWSDVMRAVVDVDADAVTLVCPTWWSTARTDRVREAAEGVVAAVEVVRRAPLLAAGAPRAGTAVVEIAAEMVVVHPSGCVIPILGADVAAKVCGAIGVPPAVLIDAPPTINNARPLGMQIAKCLRDNGIDVAWAAEDDVMTAAAACRQEASFDETRRPPAGRRLGPLAAVAATAVCAGMVLYGSTDEPEATTVLREGRISMLVPESWKVRKITSGPGSARLQLESPFERAVALHLTQSIAPNTNLATTAASLRTALAGEADGVFLDFQRADLRAGRPAVTYREVRADRHVAWTVLVDGDVRIAIGCQSPAGREELVHDACEQAITSAHASP
jgi:type VII secretion-associated protein (TIGR03931 family)